MFINSTGNTTELEDFELYDIYETGQRVYDSRYPERVPKRKKVEVISPMFLDRTEIEKINNICILYSHNVPVLCQIEYNSEIIKGVPYQINDKYLCVKVDGIDKNLELINIKDFMILEF